MQSLRNIQSIARTNYEGSNPQLVKDYLVGEDIVANRPVIEGAAATIINRANADRPGGIDTDFIVRVTDAAYPWPLATSAEARVRFALPKHRPYAH